MRFVTGYIAFLVAFGLCDAIWLSTMTPRLYRPTLGEGLLDQIRYLPAVLFYFGFPLGVVHFALMPALQDGSGRAALINGALIGLLAYATYDLTNYATLRAWTLTITLADLAYGTVVVGFCTWIAFVAVRRIEGGLG
ncbi:DUF2177 family protein [Bosea sp. BIWAKO-01]|uniref:DUF2177 family protein n=1 Tax=Bosea sp. BIWAKO-01 TaxID=506668 RepID=UPI0008537A0A|nr:DUF2177 family protein [Bosea sp. BIWAKO-01]GAU85456.1 hypothetical protein BIWAKO_05403 [Bosea sp. BIWAKO-01]